MMLRILAAIVLLALAAPAVASGHLVTSTTYADHPVHGITAHDLYRDENIHPIIDPDDGNALANLTHDHTLAMSTAPTPGGQCRVNNLTFTWHFVITLPRAVSEDELDPHTRASWHAFVARLKWHEERHRTIFVGCGQRFVPAAAKLAGPCTGLEQQVQTYIATQYAACMVAQHAFDSGDEAKVLAQPFVRLAHTR